ncbi:MAG: tRNA (guanosine(37)-N1)-methyltransferase TrmD [SAR202 cluster bacterium Io17-Chloro-G6]|nr:MAG: tRNA (guanosine(37)-N1)-methyltransferase TrmD [SAR202 cluster bacterium Io17-Chloro-G6]
MRFHVLTLFPDAFRDPLEYSMLALALKRGLVSIDVTDIRDYCHDAHHTADDYQFGGGHGMVLKAEPVFEATEAALSRYTESEREAIPIILFTPQGKLLTQHLVEELAQAPALAMICAHYAGIDNRVPEHLATHEISLGDFVLTGGELPAMALIDAVSRLVPGVIGSPENVAEDSISSGLLQHPLYTRPAEFRGMEAPEILLSGHHANIEKWRREQSLSRTLERRPDLLLSADLSPADIKYLESLGYKRPTPSQE